MKDYNEMVESLFERREKYQAKRQRRIRVLRRAASAVSCCCLILLVGVGILKSELFFKDPSELFHGGKVNGSDQYSSHESENLEGQDELDDEDASQEDAGLKGSETGGFLSDNSMDPGSPAEENHSGSGGNFEGYGHSNSSSIGSESTMGGSDSGKSDFMPADAAGNPDMPTSSIPDSSGAPHMGGGSSGSVGNSNDMAPGYYGGSYIDKNGSRVILITKDSAANRAEICEYLGISGDGVVFRSATYSLSYLKKVQNKISGAMSRNELPFVVESALMEDANRITVTVTTTDQTKLAELQAFDSAGGAIKVVFAANRSATQE